VWQSSHKPSEIAAKLSDLEATLLPLKMARGWAIGGKHMRQDLGIQ